MSVGRRVHAFGLVCAVLVVGCQPERAQPVRHASRAAPEGAAIADAESVAAVAPVGPPSYRRDIAPVFARHCAAAPDCHGEDPAHSIALDLRPAAARAQLVGVPSQARANALRVVPGDPNESFLVDKLTGALRHREGKPMPLDPETGAPFERNPLGEQFVDRVLRSWIAAGAPDN